ncbi:MAG TPA: MBL fold metallo-hydrolase, partial [Gemmatales bacterium]|nr:MBL fold metallo-hydrolase [Gemmatales bacterium]
SPVAVLLGPLIAIPITLALISSMLLVLLGSVPVLGTLLTWAVQASFGLGDSLVSFGKALPGAFTYVPDVPAWWVGIFYMLVIACTILGYWQSHFRYLVLMGLGWLLLLIPFLQPDVPQGLRLTVLSVGHGTAVVLETPDGRCLVYDAGSLAGPEVAYRYLSSYLWYRKRSSIDEVFLSHADLDHFNALPDLLDRFRVGLIRWTPSFSQKPDAGTKYTLATLERKQIPASALTLGVVLQTEGATIEVLHPPRHGPAGTENARSLVLLIQYAGRRILLTGDLEEPGLSMVMSSPMGPVDVLVAPHHGSRISNTESFAAWCKPKLVISSETYPRGPKPDPYHIYGGILWRTWVHGGITVEVDSEIRARTTLTQQTWTMP